MNNKWTHLVFIVLLVAVSILIFYNTLKNDFVADDWQVIYYKADFLKNWGNLNTVFAQPYPALTYELVPFYRPVTSLVNFINYHLSGKGTFGYHVVNVGFHTLNAILLYLLVFLIFKSELLSLFTALFFMVHPIHTSSVIWISGRTDLIAGLFVLLTVILFVKSKDQTGVSRVLLLVGSIVTYLLSLLSKETTLAIPLFLLVWDYLSKNEPIKKKLIPYIPFVIVAILYLFLRISVLGNLGTGKIYTSANIFQRFLTSFAIYFYYFKKLIFPFYLNFSPRVLTITSLFSLKLWGSLVVFIVILGAGTSLRRISKEVSFGIFWILITLLPVLNLVPLYASVKEWWAYIPSIGFCLILGKLAEVGIGWEKKLFEIKWFKPKPKEESIPQVEPIPANDSSASPISEFSSGEQEVLKIKRSWIPERILIKGGQALALFFALLLIFYAFTLKSQARVFRKDYHLWSNTAKVAPYDAVAQNAIGMILKRKGVVRWATMAFQKAVEADPNSPEARNNYGIMLEISNQDDSALTQAKEAIRLDPYYTDAYNNLGIIYGKKMEYDSAMVAFQRVLELEPTHFAACKNLGLIYAEREEFPKALEYFEKALKLAPNKQELEAVQGQINKIRVRGY